MVLYGKFSQPYSQYPLRVRASGGAVYSLYQTLRKCKPLDGATYLRPVTESVWGNPPLSTFVGSNLPHHPENTVYPASPSRAQIILLVAFILFPDIDPPMKA